jgi:hypothetical protein
MTTGAVTQSVSAGQVARPLHVLVPLIKADLEEAREAAERAGIPYFKAAGEKLAEARSQLSYSEFLSWAWRHFKIRETQANRYLSLGRTIENNTRARAPTSLSDHIRNTGASPRGAERGGASWHEPVKQVINKVDTDTLNLRKAEMNRIEERDAQRKLALQLIDIGYKALATKLHPDKGGSRDAMARLNQVRDRLKQHA